MSIMPEIIKKSQVIGRSPKGVAIVAFESEAKAREWLRAKGPTRIKLFKQTIIEQEVEIEVKA